MIQKKVKMISAKGLTVDLIDKYSILNGEKYFFRNKLQNYFVFITFNIYAFIFETGENDKIYSWKSIELSEEKNINSYEWDTNFSPELNNSVYFKGICLKQKRVSFLHKNIVNLYISYKLDTWSKDLNTDFTLGNCLFGAVKLTKNADPDKYKQSGYSIGFDLRSQFSWSDGNDGKNVIIFIVDNSSSVHTDGRNKNFLVLGERPTQSLDNATITAV